MPSKNFRKIKDNGILKKDPYNHAMKKSRSPIFLTTIFIFLLLFLTGCQEEKKLPILGDVHNHADFKVYLNNTPLNFAQEKYMSTKDKLISNFVHLHDMDGEVIHQHMSGITLKDFFESVGMELTSDCFATEGGAKYCNKDDKKLKMFVNGKSKSDFGNYEFKDLDQILITYGNDDEVTIQKQIDAVTDKACIQSQKCPERGKPHDESSCLTGGANDCLAAINGNEEKKELRKVKLFFVAMGDNGKTGKKIGCDDSIVPVEQELEVLPSNEGLIQAALEKLLSEKAVNYDKTELYNAFHLSNLTVEGVTYENGKATVKLKGTYMFGGVCDNPRFEAQLKETILQFYTVKEADIYINDQPLNKILSEEGEE